MNLPSYAREETARCDASVEAGDDGAKVRVVGRARRDVDQDAGGGGAGMGAAEGRGVGRREGLFVGFVNRVGGHWAGMERRGAGVRNSYPFQVASSCDTRSEAGYRR